ncbi:MAG: isoprenylcysteine carboxylmethyltransferase family protein [Shewanella indica]|jgi:protein-S-isoprenylcysteine O-methyltransferase Ste14|uniref:Isoprenylcysteine carboxylmethyltransferase family protein n=1 Tax=Shewanella chilikensis TaxID=558541 RepID=A0A6G7LUB5_9GAMM|nr:MULTISPECIES: isoprenylcysteine carboxylmethyltransferase family protein [Shewanella]MCL1152747.1 isoprenylcysteine carboxylmethyltransferase family protein [Shewanella chilikensis]PYE58004.1 protein-S-isoprenylcysteine O-methyltransferase Ste14 [Shewanella chilikensis]QIJ05359.1 isoprenylcysteine carboxylmethyltransferase family protein [Shewanella chilikensis]GGZ32259.1 membrane protein [Shewanella chilikensis]HCD15886.1 isoprenylcysteine carboxylmethyltransferase family protein [Shewanel
MSGLEKKLPPLALLLLFALLLQLTSYYLPSSNLHPTFSLGLAVSLLTAGLVIPLAGVLSFKRHGTTPDPRVPEQSSALVTSGIYRCSRNPMYLGFVLLLLAQAVFLNCLWLLFLIALFVAYLQRFQILPEERAMQQLFGDSYRLYCQKVRRWI